MSAREAPVRSRRAPGGARAGAGPRAPRKRGGGREAISVANHPRAQRDIRRVKGWAGLIAFVLAWLLSRRAHVPFVEATLRALIAGVVVYLLAWQATLAIWRHLLLAELEVARQTVVERRAAERARIEEAHASRAAAREAIEAERNARQQAASGGAGAP